METFYFPRRLHVPSSLCYRLPSDVSMTTVADEHTRYMSDRAKSHIFAAPSAPHSCVRAGFHMEKNALVTRQWGVS